jgi:hypothetical protein
MSTIESLEKRILAIEEALRAAKILDNSVLPAAPVESSSAQWNYIEATKTFQCLVPIICPSCNQKSKFGFTANRDDEDGLERIFECPCKAKFRARIWKSSRLEKESQAENQKQ